MKLIKQTNLAFQEGRSDKVYEVDLCEVGPDQFVVNFRYGRRGSPLRDGSKTQAPVTREKAESIFDKLVKSKTDKGYKHASEATEEAEETATTTPEPTPEPAESGATELDARGRSILARLQEGDSAPRGAWPVDRAIWRAGELALRAAEPLLIDLLNGPTSEPQLRRYAVVWALGRCGSAAALAPVKAIYEDQGNRLATRRIAGEALRQLHTAAERERFVDGIAATLPQPLSRLAREGPAEDFDAALRSALEAPKPALDVIYTAYLIDNEHTRPSILRICSEMPFAMGPYQQLRHVYKAAEYRRDGRVFGILAYRFEKERAKSWYDWATYQPEDRFFGDSTKQYFRRRTWRTLRRLGEIRDSDFCRLAVGVLLPFKDEDAQPPRSVRREGTMRHWGAFARYWALNQLLYRGSSRYFSDPRGKYFRAGTADPAEPKEREEAFPGLWDAAPTGLLHLLDESACEIVHRFAVKALRHNTDFTKQLEVPPVVMMLGRDYEVTAEFGFELAQRLYDSRNPDGELLGALADCVHEPARAQAHRWISTERKLSTENSELLARLALSRFEDTRVFVRNLLKASTLTEEVGRALIGRLIAALQAMREGDEEQAADIGQLLARHLEEHLAKLSPDVVRDLLRNPLAAVQELAGDIALIQVQHGGPVLSDVLFALLSAEHAGTRAAGVRLLEQLDDADLSQRSELLYNLATHKSEELRASVRPLIGRVAASSPEFARTIADLCMGGLRFKAEEGVHSSLLAILREELAAPLADVGKDDVLKLLRAKYSQAHELGGLLLERNIEPTQLSVHEIVRLASHDVLAVRRAAWSMSERSLDRLERAMTTATRLLDAKWEDSRTFAFDFFRKSFGPELLTPQVLVAICDSVRPDVQAFGRELITKYFRDEHGQQYLLQLSEHPSEALQLFATNYLSRYASGDPSRLRELEPYFVSVLSRVNKARIAKQRCLDFLEQQGLANREAAAVVAKILTRQSVTIAVQNRATMIVSMLRLKAAHPDLELPIEAVEIEYREEANHAV